MKFSKHRRYKGLSVTMASAVRRYTELYWNRNGHGIGILPTPNRSPSPGAFVHWPVLEHALFMKSAVEGARVPGRSTSWFT